MNPEENEGIKKITHWDLPHTAVKHQGYEAKSTSRYHKCVSSQEALEKAIKEGKIFIEVVQQKTLF